MRWLNNEEKKLKQNSEKIEENEYIYMLNYEIYRFEIRIKDDTNHFNNSLIKTYPKSKYPESIENCPIGISPFIKKYLWKDYNINNSSSSSSSSKEEENKENDEESENQNNFSKINSEEYSIKQKLNQSESIKEISPLLQSNYLNNTNKYDKLKNNYVEKRINNKRPRGSGYCENCLENYSDLYIHMENPRHKSIIESTGYYKDINIIFNKLLKLNSGDDKSKGKYIEINGVKEWLWDNPNKSNCTEEKYNKNNIKEEEKRNENINEKYDIIKINKIEMLIRRYYLCHIKHYIKVYNNQGINNYLYYHKLTNKMTINKPKYYGKIMNKFEATKIILKLYYKWKGKKYKLNMLQILHIHKIIQNVKSFSNKTTINYTKSIPIIVYEYIMFYELFVNKDKYKCEMILNNLMKNEIVSSNIYVIKALLILFSDNIEIIKLRINEVDSYFVYIYIILSFFSFSYLFIEEK